MIAITCLLVPLGRIVGSQCVGSAYAPHPSRTNLTGDAEAETLHRAGTVPLGRKRAAKGPNFLR